MQILVTLSIAIVAGLLMSRVTKLFKLPAVTAYLIAGLVVGPYLLGRIDLSFTYNWRLATKKHLLLLGKFLLGFIR